MGTVMQKNYRCPGCGVTLEFDPATQKLHCAYCEASYSVAEIEKALQELAAKFTPKNDAEKALLAEAEDLIKIPAELSTSWTKFTKDPQIIEKTRVKIDELIQKLQ